MVTKKGVHYAGYGSQIIRIFVKTLLPSLGVTDILEIALISFFIYQFMVWIKFTRLYSVEGNSDSTPFILFAYVLKMNTILWIIKNLSTILLTSVVVIFQPELRKMLEQLGQKKFMASIFLWMPAKRYRKGLQIKQSMSL